MLNGTSRNAIIWFFLALFLVSIYLLGRLLMPFASVMILAAVVTGIFKPVYTFLVRNARPGFAAPAYSGTSTHSSFRWLSMMASQSTTSRCPSSNVGYR